MNRVRDYLRQQSDPVSRNAVIAAVQGKREYLSKAIDELVLDGEVLEQPGARRSKLLSLVPGSPLVPGTTEEPDEGTTGSRFPSLQEEPVAGTTQTLLEDAA
jgi:hypothetical protein